MDRQLKPVGISDRTGPADFDCPESFAHLVVHLSR